MYKKGETWKNNYVTNKIKNEIITINDNNFFNNKTVLSRINLRALLLLFIIISDYLSKNAIDLENSFSSVFF